MWKVTRPSGSLRTLVTYTGSPPPVTLLLLGTVCGVNALFDGLGYGTELSAWFGPPRPVIPCDSSRNTFWLGLPGITRQISSPSAGSPESQSLCWRLSKRKYSLPSALIITLKHCVGSSSTGERRT